MKDKTRLIIYELFGFVLSVVPLAITLIIRREIYFKNPESGVKLTFGLITVLLFFILKAFDSFKIPKLIGVFAVVFILSYLLSSLINDLCLLSGMALVGEFLNLILISGKVSALREKILGNTISDSIVYNQSKMKYEGSGRL